MIFWTVYLIIWSLYSYKAFHSLKSGHNFGQTAIIVFILLSDIIFASLIPCTMFLIPEIPLYVPFFISFVVNMPLIYVLNFRMYVCGCVITFIPLSYLLIFIE